MYWPSDEDRPFRGERRKRKSFCWFPICFEGFWYWLEHVYITEQYTYPPVENLGGWWDIIDVELEDGIDDFGLPVERKVRP